MADQGKVKFVHIHGKLVPLHMRDKQSRTRKVQPQKTAKKPAQQKSSGVSRATKIFAVAGVAAAVGYLALRYYKKSNIPALAKLQEKVKAGGGLSVATSATTAQANKMQSGIFGMPVNPVKQAGVVLQHQNGALRSQAGHVINPTDLHEAFGSKRTFAGIFRDTGAIPKSMNLEEALVKSGGDPTKLKDLFPGGKFIIKDDSGALTKFSDFLNQDSIHSGSDKARAFLASPRRAVIQETMELSGEYRAHYLNGKVYGITHRYMPDGKLKNIWNKVTTKLGAGAGGGAFIPVMNPSKRREIRQFLTQNMDKVGGKNLGEGASLHAAFDIGQTKGGLKLIEANPSMGTFNNPLINRQFKRLATGRWGHDVSAIGGLTAGATAGTAASLTIAEKRRRRRSHA